jgi:hypothetical protein
LREFSGPEGTLTAEEEQREREMADVLAVVEQRDGKLRGVSREVVTAAA